MTIGSTYVRSTYQRTTTYQNPPFASTQQRTNVRLQPDVNPFIFPEATNISIHTNRPALSLKKGFLDFSGHVISEIRGKIKDGYDTFLNPSDETITVERKLKKNGIETKIKREMKVSTNNDEDDDDNKGKKKVLKSEHTIISKAGLSIPPGPQESFTHITMASFKA